MNLRLLLIPQTGNNKAPRTGTMWHLILNLIRKIYQMSDAGIKEEYNLLKENIGSDLFCFPLKNLGNQFQSVYLGCVGTGTQHAKHIEWV